MILSRYFPVGPQNGWPHEAGHRETCLLERSWKASEVSAIPEPCFVMEVTSDCRIKTADRSRLLPPPVASCRGSKGRRWSSEERFGDSPDRFCTIPFGPPDSLLATGMAHELCPFWCAAQCAPLPERQNILLTDSSSIRLRHSCHGQGRV